MFCKICDRKFNSLKSLQSHIWQTHKISSHQYYDKYLKKETEDVCYCGVKTNYKSMTNGYHEYCSIECQAKSKKVIAKRILKTSGENHWMKKQNRCSPNKGKTYEEIHGTEKAYELKVKLSKYGKKLIGENNPFYRKKHTEENREIYRKHRLGKTYEDIYGKEKAIEIKNKLRNDNRDTWYRSYITDYDDIFFDKKFRKNILLDQNFQCPICSKNINKKYTKNLHHINYIKKDNRRKNLIYLCVSCHSKTNKKVMRMCWKDYLNELNKHILNYVKINKGIIYRD